MGFCDNALICVFSTIFPLSTYVCMVECMYVSMYVCKYGSSALSYCKGRVSYLLSGMKIYPSVQEEGDCASTALGGSDVKSALSPLQQGHTDRQTDRRRLATQGHTDKQPMPRDPHPPRAPYARRTRTYVCMYVYVCIYVCMYVL